MILIGYDLSTMDIMDKIDGYIDFKNHDCDFEYLGSDVANPPIADYVVSVDIPAVREKLCKLYNPINLIKGYLSKSAKVGWGNVIQRNAYVGPFAQIGNGCLINVGGQVNHEARLGDYSIVAPGAIILGRVNVGKRVYIGASAVILPDIKIADDSVIGAGAVVTKDVSGKVKGVPAR